MLPAGTCRSLRDSLWFYASGVRLAAREQTPDRCAAKGRCRLLLEVRQRSARAAGRRPRGRAWLLVAAWLRAISGIGGLPGMIGPM